MVARLLQAVVDGWRGLREGLESASGRSLLALANVLPNVSKAHLLGALSALVIVVAFATAHIATRPQTLAGLAPPTERKVRLGCSSCRKIAQITAAQLARTPIEGNKYRCPHCQKFTATIYRDNQIRPSKP